MTGQGWFIAGGAALAAAGYGHVVLGLLDLRRPRHFTPLDDAVRPATDATGIGLRRSFPGRVQERPTMWSVWQGVHLTHGLAIGSFGLLCALAAAQDFALVERIDAFRPLAVAFSASLLAVCLRFFFYGPVLLTATATACFAIAAALS